MDKKTKGIIITFSVLAFIALLAWLTAISGDSQNTAMEYSPSSLAGSGQYFDFGTIMMQDGDVKHEFDIKNEGTEPVVINKVYTTCMCTEAYIIDGEGKEYGGFGMPGHGQKLTTNITIDPGESAKVRAVFDPAAHGPSGVGLAQRSIYVETNSKLSPKMELSFSAIVTR